MGLICQGVDALLEAPGQDLGVSDWVRVEQQQIDQFAAATGDHQWIHVDPVKAAEGRFGATIAHGYLTLALVNLFLPQLLRVDNVSMGVNIRLRARCASPSPVKVGSRVRGAGELLRVEAVTGGAQAVVRVRVDIEGAERPACVVDTISRYLA